MAVTERTIPEPQADVFAVLRTPETYPLWLVGCQHIRAVDADWPAPGSAFHHRVGLAGPLTVADSTKVREIEAPFRLVLEARARPFGRARVVFVLVPTDDGGTRLTIDEVPIGPLAPLQPLVDPITAKRNKQSLEALEQFLLAGRRLREGAPAA